MRITTVSLTTLSILLLAGGDPAHAAAPRGPDFDFDGFDDAAIGVPLEDVGSLTNAGLVNILYGGSSGLSTPVGFLNSLWENATAVDGVSAASDNFGTTPAWGDFNGDCFDDLAVGVPGDSDVAAGAGAINVFYGSSSGLATTNNEQIDRATSQIAEDAVSGDVFGSALAAGDFNADGFDDLAVGVPGDTFNFGTTIAGGSVHIIYGGSSGLKGTNSPDDHVIWRLTPSIPGDPDADEDFGAVLAAGDFNCDTFDDLAIGAPHQGAGTATSAGAVLIVYGSSTGLTATGSEEITQGGLALGTRQAGDTFGGSLATGNFNGDDATVAGIDVECIDLAVGVVGEGGHGAVQVFYGTSASGIQATSPNDQLIDETWLGIVSPASGDDFGFSLSGARADNDGFDDLVIGVPFADTVGAVAIARGSASGLTATNGRHWDQDVNPITDSSENGDAFGWSVGFGFHRGASNPGGLLVGAPGEGDGACMMFCGLVNSITLSNTSSPTMASGVSWFQDDIGTQALEAGDNFGDSIAPPRNRERCIQ